ncbi:MAG: stage 0 sporulation family protein [Eggerthellaceae bacterium]|nr:stage 0 sporulation family protein [Eggerthellaceae bacterium]
MVRVAPINLAYNPRTLWFDPGDIEVKKNDPVIVETARGTEFGHAANDLIEVSDDEISALKSPLKPVLRIASEEDVEKARELEQMSKDALPAFKELAAEAHPDMHPVSVEFLFDGDKAIFYFEAEERIDFRELVRRLASHFKVRIDMRQIGVRDEARIVGGLGHCGQELCCKRMGGEFCPVSIRMAKEQDLSLNPQKISGLCGRLMCCLRYEYEAYKDFKSRAPKLNAQINTPDGLGKVVELDVPREIVSVKVGEEKPVKIPLEDFDQPEEGARPHSISSDAWEFALAQAANGYRQDPVTFLTSQFTGADKLAERESVRHTPASQKNKRAEAEKAASSRSHTAKSSRGVRSSESESASVADETRKPRRRRSTKLNAGEAPEAVSSEKPKTQEGTSREEAKGDRSSDRKSEGRSRRSRRGGKGTPEARGNVKSSAAPEEEPASSQSRKQ